MEFSDKTMSFSYCCSSVNESERKQKKWLILPEDTHLATHGVAQEEEGGRKANSGIKSELPQLLTFHVSKKKGGGGARG